MDDEKHTRREIADHGDEQDVREEDDSRQEVETEAEALTRQDCEQTERLSMAVEAVRYYARENAVQVCERLTINNLRRFLKL